jgi:xylulokinase
VLAGGDEPPPWATASTTTYDADPTPAVRHRYAEVRDMTASAAGSAR